MGGETSALLASTATNWLNLYGITDGSESVGNQQSLLTRSTWLKVTGGIIGGSAVRFVAANETFTHDGSSSVTVRSVLAAPTTDTAHNVHG